MPVYDDVTTFIGFNEIIGPPDQRLSTLLLNGSNIRVEATMDTDNVRSPMVQSQVREEVQMFSG